METITRTGGLTSPTTKRVLFLYRAVQKDFDAASKVYVSVLKYLPATIQATAFYADVQPWQRSNVAFHRSASVKTFLWQAVRFLRSHDIYLCTVGDPKAVFLYFLSRLLNPRLQFYVSVLGGYSVRLLEKNEGGWRGNMLSQLSLTLGVRALLRYATKILFVSKYVRDDFVHHLPWLRTQNLVVVPNGIDPEQYYPDPQKRDVHAGLGFAENRPMLVYLGRIATSKRVPIVLDIAQRMPMLNVLILTPAKGPLPSLPENVRILYGTSRATVRRLLASSHIAILPSIQEGFALSVVEEMACGLPVLGSRSGTLPEIISDGVNGHLVPVTDHEVEDFVNLLKMLVADPTLLATLSKGARTTVEQHYAWPVIAQQYGRLFHRMA